MENENKKVFSKDAIFVTYALNLFATDEKTKIVFRVFLAWKLFYVFHLKQIEITSAISWTLKAISALISKQTYVKVRLFGNPASKYTDRSVTTNEKDVQNIIS